jgi:hypothetical protein
VEFNEKHAGQVSVSPMIHPVDVAECLRVLTDGFMRATEAFLFGSKDFAAETANRNVVDVYPLEKAKLSNGNRNGHIHGEHDPGALPRILLSDEICETRPRHQESAHNIRVPRVNVTETAQDMGRRQEFCQPVSRQMAGTEWIDEADMDALS